VIRAGAIALALWSWSAALMGICLSITALLGERDAATRELTQFLQAFGLALRGL